MLNAVVSAFAWSFPPSAHTDFSGSEVPSGLPNSTLTLDHHVEPLESLDEVLPDVDPAHFARPLLQRSAEPADCHSSSPILCPLVQYAENMSIAISFCHFATHCDIANLCPPQFISVKSVIT